MVNKRPKRKACLKKTRVISSIPGSKNVLVFCAHGCGISYTTPPQHVDKQAWHKTIRKLNAHESQRCPKNEERTRCPRKHAKVRASSTANPAVPKTKNCVVKHEQQWSPPLPGLHKPRSEGALMEAAELSSRLSEDAQIAARPEREDQVATGVYWTKPTVQDGSEVNTLALYDAEQSERCREPNWLQVQRRNFATQFTKKIFPEFLATLQGLRHKPFWERAASTLERKSLTPRTLPRVDASQQERFGHIEAPDILTLNDMEWGLGQQILIHSLADGGAVRASIVGVGGFQGSSVLVQFLGRNGMLKQQLHHAAGVASGSRICGCVFDATTKISDFVVDQTTAATHNSAGSPGRKLVAMPCEDLLSGLDNDFEDAYIEDAFGFLDEFDAKSSWTHAMADRSAVDDFEDAFSIGSIEDRSMGTVDDSDNIWMSFDTELADLETTVANIGNDLTKPSSLSRSLSFSSVTFDATAPDGWEFEDDGLHGLHCGCLDQYTDRSQQRRRPSLTTIHVM